MEMQIFVKGMPKLLREGQHWSEDNLDIASNCIVRKQDFRPSIRLMGWTHTQFYKMKDFGGGA